MLIDSIITRRGQGVGLGQEIILVGLKLSNGRFAWGDCVASSQMAVPFNIQYGRDLIETAVSPHLAGQTVTVLPDLMARLAGLTEIVTITKTTNAVPAQPKAPSRRDVLRGAWQPTTAVREPVVRQFQSERPIHAAIRYGLSQALLQAVAMAQDKSIIEVLCAEYGLPVPQTAVPLHAEINPHLPLNIASITQSPIMSVGYTTSGTNPVAELGTNGEVIQRFIRQLKNELVKTADPQALSFYLAVRGGYGTLCDENLGKILGMLYGLERAASPFLVRVEDPFILGSQNEQISKLANLRSYLRTRKMKMELVAHAHIETAVDAETFVTKQAAHMLHLDLPQMGDMGQAVMAAQLCQHNDVGVLWGGSPEETEMAARVSVQTGIAVQPTLLMVKNGRVGDTAVSITYNEMTRAVVSD